MYMYDTCLKSLTPHSHYPGLLTIVIGFWKTYHLHTSDKQNNYKYFTKLEMRLWLNSLIYLLGIH